MDYNKISNALQDLIIRLKDAEEGFKQVSNESSNEMLTKWTEKIAHERYLMHQKLDAFMRQMGEKANVHTSFLGDSHRMFILIKSNLSWNDTPALIDEIERGSSRLLDDYNKVLKEIKFPEEMATTLMSQKMMIKNELKEFSSYKTKIEELIA